MALSLIRSRPLNGPHLPDQVEKWVAGAVSTTPTSYYATVARTYAALAIAYMPTIRTITVDMSKLAGTTVARWYDPTSA
jgi:hypothetical protein